MLSRNLVFWEVDAQADFMLPGGKLYVPGAEKLLPNIRRLTDAARQGRSFWCRTAAITPRTIQSSPSFPRIVSRAPPARVGPRGADRESRHCPERSRGCLAGRSFALPADRAGKADARHLPEPRTPTNWSSASVRKSNSSSLAWSRNIASASQPRVCWSAGGESRSFGMRSRR